MPYRSLPAASNHAHQCSSYVSYCGIRLIFEFEFELHDLRISSVSNRGATRQVAQHEMWIRDLFYSPHLSRSSPSTAHQLWTLVCNFFGLPCLRPWTQTPPSAKLLVGICLGSVMAQTVFPGWVRRIPHGRGRTLRLALHTRSWFAIPVIRGGAYRLSQHRGGEGDT